MYVHGGDVRLASTTIASCDARPLASTRDGVEVVAPGVLHVTGSLLADNGIDCTGPLVSDGSVLLVSR